MKKLILVIILSLLPFAIKNLLAMEDHGFIQEHHRITHKTPTWNFLKDGDRVEIIAPYATPLKSEQTEAAKGLMSQHGLQSFLSEGSIDQETSHYNYYANSHEERTIISMSTLNYLYDENHTRYQLIKSQPGKVVFNWLFLPGGPGVDSSCFLDLINGTHVPGNYWLIDLIFNGSNEPYEFTSNNIYENWGDFLLSAVSKFENPILVGHSFGGYFPLFFPQLEELLKGLVILNSVPTLKSDLFSKCAREHDLPSLADATARLINNPTRDALKELYLLEASYFFAPQNRAKGIEQIVEKLDFCIPTEHWWYTEGAKIYSEIEIKWVPENTPTLIVGGSDDLITPLSIFEQDLRFKRDNIMMVNIPNAGHFPWVEKPNLVNEMLTSFVNRLY